MSEKATKVVIITEKVLFDRVAKAVEQAGASGYTVVDAGGKGSRGVRSTGNRASVAGAYDNIKMEIITRSPEKAQAIADLVREKFFKNYSGIIYLEGVEVLRPQKFE